MRIKFLPVLSLLVLTFVSLPISGQILGPSTDIAAQIDRYLTARTGLGRFNGVALVALDGKVILRKGYGFADIEKRIPFAPETRQEVASITKMFTSMSALMLRDKGKLKLEESICVYLDDPTDRCPDAWKPVTVQNLMRHTSGIPDYEEKLELFSPKHIEFMVKPNATDIIYADAKKLPLDFKPGEKFNYSNTGYIVLAHIVEKVSGQPYYKFVEKNILKPAGMASSGMMNYLKPPASLAAGYSGQNVGWEKFLPGFSVTGIGYKKVPQISLESPAGDAALYSTVDDLYKWSVIMDGNSKLVSAKTAQEVFTPGLEGYGYGWFIDNPPFGKRYSHTGGLPGYVTDFTKLPDKNLTVIVFSNIESVRLSRARRDVIAIALGQPWDMPVSGKVVTLTADQCKNLLGEFKLADGALVKIAKEENKDWPITAQVPKQYTAGLIPLSPTEFYMPLAEGRVTFTLDEQGRAVKVNLHYSGEDRIGERIP
jgi:CubicO group peptidase (beta-lactamase class C family)